MLKAFMRLQHWLVNLVLNFVACGNRWRDVKLRAFEQAKHRTYVDLKVQLSSLFYAHILESVVFVLLISFLPCV